MKFLSGMGIRSAGFIRLTSGVFTGMAVLFTGVSAVHAADIDSVLVRQQWPWSTAVKVEYRLTGVTVPVNINVECFDDGQPLPSGNLDRAITGRTYGLTKADEGIGFFYIDPVAAFGAGRTAMANFKVRLSLTDGDALDSEPIYRIIDLETKEVTDLSRADFYNDRGRVYGGWETNFAAIGYSPTKGEEFPYATSLKNVFIWTGVTNDIAYKTTKLVMRRIPARNKTFMMGGADDFKNDESDDFRVAVTLTNDYWLAVFETTYQQALLLQGYDAPSVSEEDAVRASSKFTTHSGTATTTYLQIRGKPSEWVGWPENAYAVASDSALQRMRTNFPGLEFDVPTEAQWEFACRAGTETMYYTGVAPDNTVAAHTAEVTPLAWFSETTNIRMGVGLLKPNALGLYDMLGNVGELIRDLHDPATMLRSSEDKIVGPAPLAAAVTEPAGWTTPDDTAYAIFRGENYGRGYNRVKCSFRRAIYNVDGAWAGRFGARLWLPAE